MLRRGLQTSPYCFLSRLHTERITVWKCVACLFVMRAVLKLAILESTKRSDVLRSSMRFRTSNTQLSSAEGCMGLSEGSYQASLGLFRDDNSLVMYVYFCICI